MSIAERIKEARLAKSWGQSELARYAGVNVQNVQHWEAGRATPRQKNAERLSLALGVSVPWLMYGQEAEAPAVPQVSHKALSLARALEQLDDGVLDALLVLVERIAEQSPPDLAGVADEDIPQTLDLFTATDSYQRWERFIEARNGQRPARKAKPRQRAK